VCAELQVLHHRHLREHESTFGYQRDAAPHDDMARGSGQRLAGEPDGAALRPQDAGDHAHRGRLAGTIGAEQGDDFARLNAERHIPHSESAIIGKG
jgi:hypothetical protein